MAEFAKFKRSLSDHPGVMPGLLWPLMLLAAVASRKDFAGFGGFSVAAWCGLGLLAALPWVAILWTAWTGRHQYGENQHG